MPTPPDLYHFSGIAGAGMNPLAQLMRARGHDVQGSDRALDRGQQADLAARLRRLGIRLVPHDGTALTSDIARFVYSAAVEADTPEMRAARALGLERIPRPALLAEVVNGGQPGIAIAGTSGKSTITAMLGWVLGEARIAATVLGGAALAREGAGGFFTAGPADGPVVAEACESDGTLGGYRPTIGLIHNVTRDHAELPALRPQFAAFAGNSGRLLVNARCPEAAALGRSVKALSYGTAGAPDVPLAITRAGPHRVAGTLRLGGREVVLDLPQPGAHSLENAAAAVLLGAELGLDPHASARRLSRFPGAARRFEVLGVTRSGIRVIDDYAHNADKLRAAITTAQAGAARLVAVFQPHGFGPARFLRADLAALLPAVLRRGDRFCYAEVFYAGGTVAKDISSRTLAGDLPAEIGCAFAADHDAVRRWVAAEARPGDTVLIMGARDPALPALARAVFTAFDGRESATLAR